jgi:Tol biopolymer transport system component/predicted Ser/Thr protein kinase
LQGKTLGPYEIVAPLGKGGMGEVYRARDSKLDREVAIKVLPREMSGDPERIARFQREARTLASLQHANIASVYGFEESGGERFLVMELVEGEDLAERLARGPVGIDDTLEFARQMAAGLEAAHEAQIVHRDLKPANVKITPDGQVKILDFGLARATLGEGGDETDLANSPTITAAMTQAGVVLGTAAYMSPEQARGKVVDRRADIWAFGVILFEMLSGKRLFSGETVSDTFAAVLRAEPDWDALPDDLPPALSQVIRRCLVRDPKARLRDVGEARVVLESGTASGWLPVATGTVEGGGARVGVRWLVLTAALVCAAAAAGWFLKPAAEPSLYQLDIMPPEGTFFHGLGSHQALSPDGMSLAFVAEDSLGRRALHVRRLDQREAVRLGGTDQALLPFWSPDSRHVGFFTNDALKRIPVGGGPAVTLAPSFRARGGTWTPDGRILFAPDTDGGLREVPASGGTMREYAVADTVRLSDRFPSRVPGSDGTYIYARWTPGDRGIVAARDGQIRSLVPVPGKAEATRDHLFYVHEGNLVAQEFDATSLEVRGDGTPLADAVVHTVGSGLAGFSVSDAGPLSFYRMTAPLERQTRVYSRDGRERQVLSTPMHLDDLALSPDARRVAIAAASRGEGIEIWTYDLQRAVFTRVTFQGSADDPVWSPDGESIIFAAGSDIARVRASGVGGTEMLLDDDFDKVNCDWSPDGQSLLYINNAQSEDLCLLDLSADPPAPRGLFESEYREIHGQFSPDGRWIAYVSDESGELQVYLVDFPGFTRKIQVTRVTASMPRWTRGGREIMVLNAARELCRIPVEFVDGEWTIGEAEVLFRTMIADYGIRTHQYDVSSDGELIVALESSSRTQSFRSPITVVTDWRQLLKARQR